MKHCVETIRAIVAGNRNDRRSVLQLGYNLGRLSELTGLGREPFWDRWKQPVADWNVSELEILAQELIDLRIEVSPPPDPCVSSQTAADAAAVPPPA